MDDGICASGPAIQEHVRRTRHDLGFLNRDVPDSCSTSDGTAHEIHGTGQDCVRFRLCLVRLPAVADVGNVAIPIPEDLQKKYGYPALTEDAKRKILGLNSARLYGINPKQQFKPV